MKSKRFHYMFFFFLCLCKLFRVEGMLGFLMSMTVPGSKLEIVDTFKHNFFNKHVTRKIYEIAISIKSIYFLCSSKKINRKDLKCLPIT